MTSAPLSQQRLLIDLQELDLTLARLNYERKHLPVLVNIEQTVARLKTNKRQAVLANAALSDAKREVQHGEREINQVSKRAQILRERLAAGGANVRDLNAMQAEIDQLGRRQSQLEEAQLEAMEAVETAQQAVAKAASEENEIRLSGRELTAQRDAEFSRLDAEISQVSERRQALAGAINPSLLADYDATRAATGGLGAVALYGRRLQAGAALEISPQEYARIASAPPDEVIHAEDNDVIIVRMEE